LIVPALVNRATFSGVAVRPDGDIVLLTNGANPSAYDLSIVQPVTPPAAGTIALQTTKNIAAIPVGEGTTAVDFGTWLPSYGGDFKVEVGRGGLRGALTNFVHVGPFAQGMLATATPDVAPGDQLVPAQLKLSGADFTTISRVETGLVRKLALIARPRGMVGDKAGNLYFTDDVSLRKVSPTGVVSLVASGLTTVFGLAIDSNERFYLPVRIANGHFQLLRITIDGTTTVVADLGTTQVNGVGVDSRDDVLVGSNGRLLKVDPATGAVATVTTFGIPQPRGIAIDGRDNVYVQNEFHLVTLIRPNGSVSTIFSQGDGINDPVFEGDGFPNIAADCADNFYIAVSQWAKINQAGEEHTLAQVIARTGQVALLFDGNQIDPVGLGDIDYLAYDRFGNRILLWSDNGGIIWQVPVTCGAIGVEAHLFTVPGQTLSGANRAPSAILQLADGRTEYVWSLRDVPAAGLAIGFDTLLRGLSLGETRPLLDSAFILFRNSFSPVDVELPIDVPTVSVANLVSMTVGTDLPEYQANATATISTLLQNANAVTVAGELTVSVFDAAGALVGTVTQQGVTVPASGQLPLTGVFGVGRIPPGVYTVRSALTSGAIERAKAQTTFRVLADDAQGTAKSRLSLDKPHYLPSDRVLIGSRAMNVSTNVLLENLTLAVQVTDSSGAVLFTRVHTIGQLPPGSAIDLSATYAFQNAPPAAYTVTQTLRDAAGGLYDTHQASYDVLSTLGTGFGLTGTVSSTPSTVRPGATVNVVAEATNEGNGALSNLPLKIVIVDPESNTVLSQWLFTATLVPGASIPLAASWVTQGRPGATFLVVLSASVGNAGGASDMTLAFSTFALSAVGGTHIAAIGGTPQTVVVDTTYAQPLQVLVSDDSGQPQPGVVVTFAAPSSGASVSFPNGNTATTDANGRASVTARANGFPGAVTVIASAPGAINTVAFALTQLSQPITQGLVPIPLLDRFLMALLAAALAVVGGFWLLARTRR
jgi:hypothetical protein